MSLWDAIGGLGSAIAGMFGGDPESKYQEEIGKIPGYVQQYYGPYLGAGQNELGNLMGQYGQMTGDPSGLIGKLAGQFNYQESPGYKFQVKEATDAANRAAAAGGMLGSPAEQAQLGKTVTGLASQDYQNAYERYMQWLDRVLGVYGQGIRGEQGIEGQGFGAAQGALGDMAQYAQMKGRSEAESQQRKNDFWSSIGGLLGGAVGGAGNWWENRNNQQGSDQGY